MDTTDTIDNTAQVVSTPTTPCTQTTSTNVQLTSATTFPKYRSQYVKLNVGGELFHTTLRILSNCDFLVQILHSYTYSDKEDCVVIDRCGKHFGTILDYLKNGTVELPENIREVAELLMEVTHYKIDELVEMCQQILTKEERKTELFCRVPLVTSGRETRFLINTTRRPVIKLLVNRHNNTYSYTYMSDDNLLKNIELFDKLSLKYQDRILFVKDVDDVSDQICSWSFIRSGKLYNTVCCTSTVYETDKMYTKVEFPEWKINKETDVILRTLI